ncbi:MAG: Hpt domain-containing protein [Spirochaetales bacterium]|jgi:HPt (histidine-containing phosphotransfer) domain-containing protein|nr:Hpt domain-containing protein [Spirochaetales bacterium]
MSKLFVSERFAGSSIYKGGTVFFMDGKYIDLKTGLGRVRGNAVIYKKMLGMFLDSKEFAAFDEALAAGDYQKAADVAHAIKGLTGNLALTPLFEESTSLMNQLRGGAYEEATLQNYRTILTETRDEVKKLIEAP